MTFGISSVLPLHATRDKTNSQALCAVKNIPRCQVSMQWLKDKSQNCRTVVNEYLYSPSLV